MLKCHWTTEAMSLWGGGYTGSHQMRVTTLHLDTTFLSTGKNNVNYFLIEQTLNHVFDIFENINCVYMIPAIL